VKAVDKSLKKEGASIEKYNPFFFKRFIESFDPLKYEIISWDWYYFLYPFLMSDFAIPNTLIVIHAISIMTDAKFQ
jgi:hypothetical protein